MPENYINLFSPEWLQQGAAPQIQSRLGIIPLTDKQKIRAERVVKELDNPGVLASEQNYNTNKQLRARGIVEKNPGLRPMGEVIDPNILYFIPGVGDALLAGEAVYDVAKGNYGDALIAAGLLAAPSAAAGAGKTVSKLRRRITPPATKAGEFVDNGVEYVSYMSSQKGTPSYYFVPKEEVTRGAKQWVPTQEEIVNAMAKYLKNTKQATLDATRTAVDKKASYSATVLAQEKKATNKVYRKESGHKYYNTTGHQNLKAGKDVDGVSTILPRPDLEYLNIDYDYMFGETYLVNFEKYKKHLKEVEKIGFSEKDAWNKFYKMHKQIVDKEIAKGIYRLGGKINYLNYFGYGE